MSTIEFTLQQAEINLEEASENYQAAVSATSAARTAELTALNALNDAQKKFDKLVEVKKSKALLGSDWYQKRHEK